MKRKFIAFSLFCLTAVLLTGCVISFKAKENIDGGVFVSNDKGENWSQTSLIYRVSDIAKTFSNIDLIGMTVDPLDSKALYVATHDKGMFYTYDGGTGWHQTLENKGRINTIAISPRESCIIYVAIANRIYKSTDCNRHWDYQLIEPRADPNNQITALAVDNNDSNIVYAGTSGKGLFNSADGGYSWHVIKFFDDRIVKLLILPSNTNIIYVVTASKGIFKTTDKGQTWTELFNDETKKQYAKLLVYRDVILDPTVEDGLLYACPYGLFRSGDGGQSWQNIKLLTPPDSVNIYSVGINPQNGQEIYYGIDKVLYRSEDGGANWITRNLPTVRAPEFLYIDPANPSRLYLGVQQIKQ